MIDALVTWFKSVVTYDNGEYSQQNYNKSPYSNVVETCMHYRGLGVCRHHVATFEFCLQTIAQLDTYRCSVSPITSANGDSLTYQLFTNGSPTHCVLCLWLDNTVYVIDPTGSSHSPTNVSRGAGGPSSRRNGRQDRDFFFKS